MYEHETKLRVRYAETDQMGVVYHGHYFQYFEAARGESVRDMGLSYADIEKMGVIMPVIEVQARYLRPARYDELLTIKTRLHTIPTGHRVEYEQEVWNEKNEKLTTATVILYFMKADGSGRTTMPEVLKEKLLPFFT